MRRVPSSLVSLCGALLALAGGAGCQPNSEILVGLYTDLTVPGEADLVTLQTDNHGVPVKQWKWSGEGLVLPGSIGLYTDNGSTPTLSLSASAWKGSKRLLERRAVVQLVSGRELFLRLGLAGTCADLDCPANQTCVDGECASPSIDAATLPAYRPGLERTLECDSGPRWIDTATGDPLPVAGTCPAGQRCQEGTCLPDP